MSEGATCWELTCSVCGHRWQLIGFGRWRKLGMAGVKMPRALRVGDGMEGPERIASSGATITRTVHKTVVCHPCWMDEGIRAISEPRGLKIASLEELRAALRPQLMWWYLENFYIPTGGYPSPDLDDTKTCIYCGDQFPIGRRSDSCYCSKACLKGCRRRLDQLRAGRPLTPAMDSHTPPQFLAAIADAGRLADEDLPPSFRESDSPGQ